jgi:predicted nucleic acid-binding protein
MSFTRADTNILAYVEGVNGAKRKSIALDLLQRLPSGSALLPVQTLGELFQLLVRKANRTSVQARAAILGWRDAFPLIATSESVIVGAAELATSHRFSFWDGVVLASSAEAECRLLLSEDLQEGFTWNSVTVTNPFGESSQRLLAGFLQ